MQLYQHEWNWKNEKLCGNTTPAGRSVFTKFRVFPFSTSVDITVYLYGKNVLYFFYNIAQKNTKLLQWMSGGKFSVFTLSYVNTALNRINDQNSQMLYYNLFVVGDAGDSLNYHNGYDFSTHDNDNDIDNGRNCAAVFQGGWWYRKCLASNLNGHYIMGGNHSGAAATGVHWLVFTGTQNSLKYTEMKIRPKN